MRMTGFVLALLLLGGAVEPTRGPLIALTVVTGLAFARPRMGLWTHMRPRVDLRLASFILAALLLAGVIAPTKDWLIVLSVITGIAMVAPGFAGRLLGLHDGASGTRRYSWDRGADFDDASARRFRARDRRWRHWEARMGRRRARDAW